MIYTVFHGNFPVECDPPPIQRWLGPSRPGSSAAMARLLDGGYVHQLAIQRHSAQALSLSLLHSLQYTWGHGTQAPLKLIGNGKTWLG